MRFQYGSGLDIILFEAGDSVHMVVNNDSINYYFEDIKETITIPISTRVLLFTDSCDIMVCNPSMETRIINNYGSEFSRNGYIEILFGKKYGEDNDVLFIGEKLLGNPNYVTLCCRDKKNSTTGGDLEFGQ